MRIRFFMLDAYAGSGLVRATFQSAAALAERHDVDIVSVTRRRDRPMLPLDARVPIHSLIDVRSATGPSRRITAKLLAQGQSRLAQPGDKRSGRYFTLLSDALLVRSIRELREGLVIGTGASINVAVARFARPSVYAVAQDHQHLRLRPSELRAVFAEFYPRLDAMVPLTPGDAADYASMLPPTVLVRDIPNALPDRTGVPRADGRSQVVVAAGRLARQKGFDLLVAAFDDVHRRHPYWQLHIFGRGAERASLESAIHDRGLQDVVVLRGFSASLVDDMAATGSIFALSSRFEGYPMVLLEAMSLGLPPVAFNCQTGPSDIIEDGTSGLLVRPRKVAELARAINGLIEDPVRRDQMSVAARQAAKQFSASVVTPRWTCLIEELASREPGRRREPRAWPQLRLLRTSAAKGTPRHGARLGGWATRLDESEGGTGVPG